MNQEEMKQETQGDRRFGDRKLHRWNSCRVTKDKEKNNVEGSARAETEKKTENGAGAGNV
jgi:hypothetical protein